ncbi:MULTISPECIES: hypothetical protein [unclassified Microbacterium]|uniref:hypothetical protein n=1 Tax=unclassified Microbacterium TaxID=2609290 RepID=UPI000EAAC4F4|nr:MULTISPECIES: hypothetical protein [unclassified Microbacterium]MBT2483813.1 hypothetical protein [Microbacterium sp. ISL-108]RKN66797.1 hypothetical protein D7252_03775 [Microbacterium sp. CGR2]
MEAAPSMTSDTDRRTIRGADYTLSWRIGARGLVRSPYFEFADGQGARWMRLSALSSIHTRAARDEAMRVFEPEVREEPDAVIVTVRTESSAWRDRILEIRCTREGIEVTLEAEGEGDLTDVTLLGGDGILPTGASGTFRSGFDAQSLSVPSPTEPVAFIRPIWSAASVGVVGDADPGRLNGIFSPPPLALAFGRSPATDPFTPGDGPWLASWLRDAVQRLTFTMMRFDPVDDGALLRLTYDGHTTVSGRWRSPTVVIRPTATPTDALLEYRADLIRHGFAPEDPIHTQRWWLEPIFCGWGAQVARGGEPAPELCRQEIYDEFLETLDAAALDPGTIVIDDRWQAEYGTAEPDTEAWPDMRGWIDRQHAAGRKVLLWWKAWDPAGLPPEECITDAAGRPVAVDPGSPAYTARLARIVEHLLSPDGMDADGFKVDFTQRTPSGMTMRSAPDSDGPWGIAALHRLVAHIHDTATRIKPDALVITHTVHPSFGAIAGMIRTNDVLEHDTAGRPVSVAAQLRARHEIVAAVLPQHPVDTDQWPMPSRDEWLDYARAQGGFGVPALYYLERVGETDEPIDIEHLAEIGRVWERYRETLA